MHKLDLINNSSTETPNPTEPIVDETVAGADNQRPLPTQDSSVKKVNQKMIIGLSIFAVVAGIATGYGTHRLTASSGSSNTLPGGQQISQIAGDQVFAGEVFGSTDIEAFKDDAQGYLEKGGINGEGSHKLLRPGGESQTVYLTSSVTDLDKLAGMEVKVWGETFKAQKAGWLMDVGRVEVVKVDAKAPVEE